MTGEDIISPQSSSSSEIGATVWGDNGIVVLIEGSRVFSPFKCGGFFGWVDSTGVKIAVAGDGWEEDVDCR